MGTYSHRILQPLSDSRSFAVESSSNRNEAEKFEFEPCPQASKFSSWKVSSRTEVVSGSTHARVISQWLEEIDLAAGMEELDYSGFIVDQHQIEFETLDSKIAERNHEDNSCRIQEKDLFLVRNSIPKQTSSACGQATYLFVSMNKTQEHTMNLSDLLHVELYNDNLKMFNQAWQ